MSRLQGVLCKLPTGFAGGCCPTSHTTRTTRLAAVWSAVLAVCSKMEHRPNVHQSGEAQTRHGASIPMLYPITGPAARPEAGGGKVSGAARGGGDGVGRRGVERGGAAGVCAAAEAKRCWSERENHRPSRGECLAQGLKLQGAGGEEPSREWSDPSRHPLAGG